MRKELIICLREHSFSRQEIDDEKEKKCCRLDYKVSLRFYGLWYGDHPSAWEFKILLSSETVTPRALLQGVTLVPKLLKNSLTANRNLVILVFIKKKMMGQYLGIPIAQIWAEKISAPPVLSVPDGRMLAVTRDLLFMNM